MGVSIIGNINVLRGDKWLSCRCTTAKEVSFNTENCSKGNLEMCSESAFNKLRNYKGVKSNKTVKIIRNGKYTKKNCVEYSVKDRLKFMEFSDLIRIYGIEYGENCKEKDILDLVLYSEECVNV